ncbi:MAG TPA: ABC transporter permease [Vicinamibacterales bacterium]|nr:ABC transporter permease [Vicinamibacterales bacterium]
MRRVIEGWRRLRAFRRRTELETGLDEEIRFHIDRQTEKNLRAGMSADEARRQALIRFGGVDHTKERARDQFRAASIEDLVRDIRHGGRALLRAPGFTIVAMLTLALGIGATTAMFSIVNGILLRPLPYPEQDRLVELVHEAPGLGVSRILASPAVYFGYRDHSRTFEAVGMWDWDASPVTVTGLSEPESVRSVELTHEVLGILGAAPAIGRSFVASDDVPGAASTAVISHAYWQRRFGGASPIGRTVVVDGVAREVIGVLPEWFRFFDYPADIFYPMQLVRSEAGFPRGDGRGLARLKPGVTVEQANADARRMIPLINAEFGRPGPEFDRMRFAPNLRPLKEMVVGNLDDTLWLLMGTIGLLLLIACANVANLVLVRTQSRRSELSVRTALGARWGDIARVVLAENAILGLAGGVLGVAIAYVSLPYLHALGGDDLPYIMTVRIDLAALLAALAMSAFATVIVAFIPVVRFARPQTELAGSLQGGARGIADGHEGHHARRMLLVAQVALALVLLVGCGLMIRTFVILRQVDPGFQDPSHVQTFQLTLPVGPGGPQAEPEAVIRMLHRIADRLAAVPGVQSAAFTSANDGLPLDGDGRSAGIFVDGKVVGDSLQRPKEIQFASPGFFETMMTPLVAGRTFEWNDVYQRRSVALVSENFARAEWGSAAAAIGRRIGPGPTGPWLEIVGVVKDVRHNGLNAPAPETVILPPVARATATFVVRSSRAGTSALLDELRRAVWSVNGDLSPAIVQTLGEMYDRSMARTSMSLRLLAITGLLALVLGLVGVYGLVSYAVAQRQREIGIRLALGAGYGEVRRMFVRHALGLVTVGVGIGLVAALVLTRLMESQLFGISPLDPATHLAVALLLVVAAGLASYVAARRASALDPVEVLRGV